MHVYVNDQKVPKIDPKLNPQASGWSYSKSSNSILFHNGAIPPSGASIKVVYFG